MNILAMSAGSGGTGFFDTSKTDSPGTGKKQGGVSLYVIILFVVLNFDSRNVSRERNELNQ